MRVFCSHAQRFRDGPRFRSCQQTDESQHLVGESSTSVSSQNNQLGTTLVSRARDRCALCDVALPRDAAPSHVRTSLVKLTSRRLQQIAISCKRSCYNICFNKKYELHQCSFHCHHEVLEERRQRMPPLVLIWGNWFRSLFSRFTVETVEV